MSSKLTLLFQHNPGWFDEFVDRCQGRLAYVKTMDFYPNRPDVRVIGRPFVEDGQSNAWIDEGAAGAVRYVDRIRDTLREHGHVWAWQIGNEYLLRSQADVDRYNAFALRAIALMSSCGHRVMLGNTNTGWPRLQQFGDPPPWPRSLRPTLNALIAYDGVWSAHEYSARDIRDDPGNILRICKTRDEAGGWPFPWIVIGELGLDAYVQGRHYGWRDLLMGNWPAYLAMLKWYDAQIRGRIRFLAASIFVVGYADWASFNIDREQAMELAAYIAST